MTPDEVLQFWFHELTPKQHFVKDAALDASIRQRFGAIHAAAARSEAYGWRQNDTGRLAEIIVLDQFSRNLFRNDPRAFATDAMALVLAQELVQAGSDHRLPVAQRAFAYMPYMHSESTAIHAVALSLFDQPGLENHRSFEIRHKTIIDRFGRYPHRNATLGRASTAEELAFLRGPGSSF